MLHQITLAEAYEDFVLYCRSRKLSPATLRFYHTQLTPFVAYCADKSPTSVVVRRYLASLADRDLKDTTVHAAARAIRTFLRFCAVEGHIEKAPKITMPKVGKHILPVLTADEAKTLVGACKTGRDRALILTALDTGLRSSELAGLRVGDVEDRMMRVRSGKGDKDRTVYIGATTRRALNAYLRSRGQLEATDPLWLNLRTGEALTRWGVRELCDRLSAATGVQVSPHKLRRTAAVLALQSGMPLPMVQAMLGHESLSTTQRYLALTDEDRRKAHEQYGAIDKLVT